MSSFKPLKQTSSTPQSHSLKEMIYRPQSYKYPIVHSPKYSQLIHHNEYPDFQDLSTEQEYRAIVDADRRIFAHKISKLVPGVQQPLEYSTVLTRYPLHILNYAYVSQTDSTPIRDLAKYIQSDELPHFLITHKGRRLFERMGRYYHIHRDIWDIIFPCGFSLTSRPRTLAPCMYHCRAYYQSCHWHTGFQSYRIAKLRALLLDCLGSIRHDYAFWLSLMFNLKDEGCSYEPIEPEAPSRTQQCVMALIQGGRRRGKKQWKITEGLQELESPFVEDGEQPLLLTCPVCIHTYQEGEENTHEKSPQHQQALQEIVQTEFRPALSRGLNTLIDTISSVSELAPSWLARHIHFLVSLLSNLVSMIFSRSWISVIANVAAMVNECVREFPQKSKLIFNDLGEKFKKVIRNFFPLVQAQPSLVADNKAANESFVTTLLGIFTSFIPGVKVEADVLKARVQKIEMQAKILSQAKSMFQWVVTFFDNIWTWIQIYWFGATTQELEEAKLALTDSNIQMWINDVRAFERGVDAQDPGATRLLRDESAQSQVLELKSRGENILARLAVDEKKCRQLSILVTRYLNKVEKWYKVFEDSLGGSVNKHEPFVIYLYGEPNVGKSFCADYIAGVVAKALGKKDFNPANDIFAKPRNSEYWDGYNNQFCCIFDDYLQVVDQTLNASELAFLIDVGSRSKMHLNMADLPKKSTSYFNSELVIFTSNRILSPEGMETMVVDFAALARRVDMLVEMRKVPEVERDKNLRFDPSGLIFSCSRFEIDKSHSAGGRWKPIESPMTWDMFTIALSYWASAKQQHQLFLDGFVTPQCEDVIDIVAPHVDQTGPSSSTLHEIFQREASASDVAWQYQYRDVNTNQIQKRQVIALKRKTPVPSPAVSMTNLAPAPSVKPYLESEISSQCPLALLPVPESEERSQNNCFFDAVKAVWETKLTSNQLRQYARENVDAGGFTDEATGYGKDMPVTHTGAVLFAHHFQHKCHIYIQAEDQVVPDESVGLDREIFLTLQGTSGGETIGHWVVSSQEDIAKIKSRMMRTQSGLVPSRTCPAHACNVSFSFQEDRTRVLRHFLERARRDRYDNRGHSDLELSVMHSFILSFPRRDMRFVENGEFLSTVSWDYQPIVNYYSAGELFTNDLSDLFVVMREDYEQRSRKTWAEVLLHPFKRPVDWFAKVVQRKMDAISTVFMKPVESITDAIDQARKSLDDAMVMLRKWALIGLATVVILGTIVLCVQRRQPQSRTESFGPSASQETHARKKQKVRIEGDEDDQAGTESFGPSASQETHARQKKRVRIEEGAEEIRMSESFGPSESAASFAKKKRSMRIECRYVAPFRIRPYSDEIQLTQVMEDPDVEVRLRSNCAVMKWKDQTEEQFNYDDVNSRDLELCKRIVKKLKQEEESRDKPNTEGLKQLPKVAELTCQYPMPMIEGSTDPSASAIIQRLKGNLALVVNTRTGMVVRGTIIAGHSLLVPQHVVGLEIDPTVELSITTNTGTYLHTLKEMKAKIVPKKDSILLNLAVTKMPMKPSMIGLFMKETDTFESTNGYLMWGDTATAKIDTTTYLQVLNITLQTRYEYSDKDGNGYEIASAATYNGDTCEGYCGSLLVRFDKRAARKIMGFHVAGSTGCGVATLWTSEALEKLVSEEEMEGVILIESFEEVNSEGIMIRSPEEKARVQAMQILYNLAPEHSITQPRTTKLRHSPLFNKISETQSGPSPQRPFVMDDGEIVYPLVKALSMLDSPQIVFDQDLVDDVADIMETMYWKNGWLELKGTFGKLSMEENIKGSEEDEWIKPLNMHTSPGYPYVLAGDKRMFIDPEQMFVHPILQEAIERRERAMKEGRNLPAVMVDVMKDERLPDSKRSVGKVRVFNVCPIDFNLLVRKYFLRFLSVIMERHVENEVTVGINVHDESWAAFYRRIRARGDHWIAGDYSAWDKRAPLQVALALLPMIEDFYKQYPDYEESDAAVRRGLIMQAFQSTRVAVDGAVNLFYQVHQSMPSGVAVTAVYNSLINSLLFRIIFAELAMNSGWKRSKALHQYDRHVSFAAYGDDHVARVSSQVLPFFNMKTISEQMAKHYITYTSPSKERIDQETLSDDELTFLKRQFLHRGGRIDAPMPVDKVLDILNWVKAETEAEAREATQCAVLSVLTELSHHDREVFNHWYQKIKQECRKARIVVPTTSYDAMVRKRLEGGVSFDYDEF